MMGDELTADAIESPARSQVEKLVRDLAQSLLDDTLPAVDRKRAASDCAVTALAWGLQLKTDNLTSDSLIHMINDEQVVFELKALKGSLANESPDFTDVGRHLVAILDLAESKHTSDGRGYTRLANPLHTRLREQSPARTSRRRRPGAPIHQVHRGHNYTSVRSWVTEYGGHLVVWAPHGTLTPLIGPGVNQIGGEVITVDKRLEDTLEGEERSFYEGLRDLRSENRTIQASVNWADEDLAGVVNLVRLAAAADNGLKSGLSRHQGPVSELMAQGVELLEVDFKRFLDRLEECIDRFQDRRAEGVDLLGRSAIRRRLKPWRDRIKRSRSISQEEVEWLADLAWHGIIHNSSIYPTIRELVLQVGLVYESNAILDPAPPRRLDPPRGLTPQRLLPDLERAVVACVDRGTDWNRVNKDRSRFYDELAQEAHARFQHRLEELERPFPVLLTTNFDLEMEIALANQGESYHVAIPVWDPDTDDANWAALRWITKKFSGRKPADITGQGENDWVWLSDHVSSGSLSGPLLLKLNGSPLHSPRRPQTPESAQRVSGVSSAAVPTLRRSGQGQGRRLEHAIAIGEFDLMNLLHLDIWGAAASMLTSASQDGGLKASGTQPPIPSQLLADLDRPERRWLLLGLRLSDWNFRMQLFLYAGRYNPEGSEGHFVAVNKAIAEDRSELLRSWQVDIVMDDMSELTEPLGQYTKSFSSEVRR